MVEGKGVICAKTACQPVDMKEKVKSVREMWENRKDV